MINGAADQPGKEFAWNVTLYDKYAGKYDALHGEIFNPDEQTPLRAAFVEALGSACSGATANQHRHELRL